MESSNTTYPCHINPTVSNEQFIPEHIFIHLQAGSMTVYDGSKEYIIQSGDYCLARRNHLARYSKRAPANGQFKVTSMFFNPDFLSRFNSEYGYSADTPAVNDAIIKLRPNPLLENYTQSLTPYLNLTGDDYADFLPLKVKELLFILLKTNPDLKNVLFDLSDPGKIDLEAFMARNYKFNVSMKRLSYLTGRSLTSFKRDFEKIFNNSPGRWLLEKRLQEAHFLIQKEGQKPSDVYLEVGFEDLSHFSYAFKKRYGFSPNQLKKASS